MKAKLARRRETPGDAPDPPEGAAAQLRRGRRLLRQADVADRIACRFDWCKIGSVLTLDSLADTPPPSLCLSLVDLLTNDDDHRLATFIDRSTCAISRLSAASTFSHGKIPQKFSPLICILFK